MIELAILCSIASPFRDKRASCVEFLDAVILSIGNIHISCAIDINTIWLFELAILCSIASPFRDKRAS